ncbi:arsenate reductase family protein [Tenacibaculum piscium]|uniref:arsenate reductase family protein n=1 Tax=Tenacibaculum piscium TaxID=1458515 RepID=UPI00187B550A|nr:ArsC/Spx/MgsR family protein [Tenacibaculum piscium]MBE7671303.1 arsenate reductase [Tenacibaculum piscium]MBE7686204.1 arsenate reductase [Tenacibaculum piscium]MBE7689940.1 arsenate reductase [Tenacibaculum piscium]
MKKVYFLQTCDTCKRILKEVNLEGFEKQEIKTNKITVNQLEEMRKLTDSYESLFNKRARLYKEKDLKNKEISENEYRDFILEEYTFLKRPVFILEDKIFIGNSKKVVETLKEAVN